jgi:hypothetical protein
MDKAAYEERVKRIKEVDSQIKTLDPAIRELSFKLLQAYITGEKQIAPASDADSSADIPGSSGESILAKFDHDKPSDNVFLIMAEHFREYGNAAFGLDEIRQTAANVGLTIPSRPDMTLRKAIRDGKKLFVGVGKGKYKPTVHGEKFLKETYDITKGIKPRTEDND